MRIRLGFAALIAAFALAIGGASAQVYSGTTVNGTLTSDVNSANAYVGQPVTLVNVTSTDGSGRVVRGKLFGNVTEVQRAGQGRAAKLSMHFRTLVLPNGAYYTVDTTVTGMQANTKNNTLKEAAGALGGMLVGNAIGKTIFHASGGGLVGLAGGYMIAKNNRENMTVPAGSIVTVRLNSVVRRQSH